MTNVCTTRNNKGIYCRNCQRGFLLCIILNIKSTIVIQNSFYKIFSALNFKCTLLDTASNTKALQVFGTPMEYHHFRVPILAHERQAEHIDFFGCTSKCIEECDYRYFLPLLYQSISGSLKGSVVTLLLQLSLLNQILYCVFNCNYERLVFQCHG